MPKSAFHHGLLVDADHNQRQDVYVQDLVAGQLTLESVGPNGIGGNGDSINPDISSDGRFVVFESAAGNLTDVAVAAESTQVFLRDRGTGATHLLSSNTRPA